MHGWASISSRRFPHCRRVGTDMSQLCTDMFVLGQNWQTRTTVPSEYADTIGHNMDRNLQKQLARLINYITQNRTRQTPYCDVGDRIVDCKFRLFQDVIWQET